jgi:hypothetical protein
MHPDMLRALARARHDDLLAGHRIRGRPSARPSNHVPRFARSRQRVGSLLIWAGARLLGEERAALELTHE